MMLRNITLKTIRDRRISLIWWNIGFVAMVIGIAALYPSIKESAAPLAEYMANLPDAVKALFGGADLTDIASPTGFFNAELFGLMVPIMFIIFATGFGSSTIAGEEERGTMDLLLANPVSRQRVVIEKFLALVLSTALLGFMMWLSLVLSSIAFDITISSVKLAAVTLTSVLLGLSFGMIGFATGCLTGKRSLAVAAATILASGSYIFNAIAKIVEAAKDYERLSLFYYHSDINPLKNGIDVGDVVPFIAVIAIALVIGIIGFNKRDLAS